MSPNRDKIYLLSAEAIKAECDRMFKQWEANGKPSTYRDNIGELKAQPSRDMLGATKIMMYLKPDKFRMKGLPGLPTTLNVPTDMKTGPTQPVGGSKRALPMPQTAPKPVQPAQPAMPAAKGDQGLGTKPGIPVTRA